MKHNLKAEMARKRICNLEIAEKLGIDEKTFRNKLNAEQQFKFYEAEMIRDLFFPEETLGYLFMNKKIKV